MANLQSYGSGKYLKEKYESLNRWTKYCPDLYNYCDSTVLDCPQIPDEEPHNILGGEVYAAVKALETGMSVGVNNIPAELVQAGVEAIRDFLT